MKKLLVALLALVLLCGIGVPALEVAGPEYPPDGESVPGYPIDDAEPPVDEVPDDDDDDSDPCPGQGLT